MSLVNLLGPVKVVANEDGTITATLALGAGGAPKKWREVAPYLWQDTASTDRLAADVVDGKVTRFTMEPYAPIMVRSDEHTSELQSLLRNSYAVFGLTKKKNNYANT